jgi:ribokinase
MSNGKITVFGSFIVDLMARTPRLPLKGETVKGSMFKIGPGGKGSNQGVAAHRAGGNVTMITKIGDDDFSPIALNNFKNEKMNTEFIFIDKKEPTGTALIMVDEKTSDNKIVVTPGASENITAENIEDAKKAIEDSDVFLIQLETNMDAVEKSIDIAYSKDVKIILNPAPAHPLSDDILNKIFLITPNETEAYELTGIEVNSIDEASKAAKVFMSKGVKNVIITMGASGSYATSGGEEKFIKSRKVDAVDTTGAGDAYNGGLVVAIAEGKNIFQAAEFANAVGALSVTKFGTAPAMPFRVDIDSFIKSYK